MALSFTANALLAYEEDGVTTVALAGSNIGDPPYLLLQRAESHDAQDVALRMDTYHLERDDQKWSCYGGVTRVELGRSELWIALGPKAATHLAVHEIRVTFTADWEEFSELRSHLARIFADANEVSRVGF